MTIWIRARTSVTTVSPMRRYAFLALSLFALPAEPASARMHAMPEDDANAEIVATHEPPAPLVEAPDPNPLPPKNRKRVHLKKGELTLAVARHAARYLSRAMGTETLKAIEGRWYSFCVEEHYHAPGSGLTPEGSHKGVTVYGLE